MIEEGQFILELAKDQMEISINRLEEVLSKIRAGKANPQMISNVKVDYYGTLTPLSQMSNINTPDSQTISIQPFDKSIMEDIERSIIEANLGFNPINNGELIMINVPALTEERRIEIVKQVKVEIENGKISVRNARQKANEETKKLSKEGISEDVIRDLEIEIQNLTNNYISIVDKYFEEKQKELMKI